MEKLTIEQKVTITKEMVDTLDIVTLGTWALVRIAKDAIVSNVGDIEMSTEIDVEGKKYKVILVVTNEEVKLQPAE